MKNHLKTAFSYLLFPIVWGVYNIHYAYSAMTTETGCNCEECLCESDVWQVYDSSVYTCFALVGFVAFLFVNDKKVKAHFGAISAYFFLTLIMQFTLHNYRNDPIDEVVSGVCVMVVSLTLFWVMVRRNK